MKKLFEKYRELIKYIVCGVMTTVINYVVHFSLRAVDVNYYISLTVAGVLAVTFSYFANRVFVFESKAKGRAAVKEFFMFLSGRVMSFVLELIVSFVLIDCLSFDRFVWTPDFADFEIPVGELAVKTFCMGFVVITNYIFSKLVIFKKEK